MGDELGMTDGILRDLVGLIGSMLSHSSSDCIVGYGLSILSVLLGTRDGSAMGNELGISGDLLEIEIGLFDSHGSSD